MLLEHKFKVFVQIEKKKMSAIMNKLRLRVAWGIFFVIGISAEWDGPAPPALLKDACSSDRHVHLSTGKDASTSITVSFSSLPCDVPSKRRWKRNRAFEKIPSSLGAVLIGHDQEFKSFRIVQGGRGVRYNTTQNHGDVYWSEYQHHITISGLSPDTDYYYKCLVVKDVDVFQHRGKSEDDYEDLETKENERRLTMDKDDPHVFQFRMAPKRNRSKFAILGDLGEFSHTKEMLATLASQMNDIDSIVMVGDLSYANGRHRKWDTWFDMLDLTNILKRKPLYIVSGNHDVEGDLDTGLLYQAFETRFRMPHVKPPVIGRVTKEQDVDLNRMYQLPYDFGNSFYSYENGLVHNIVLNSFADFEPGSNQYKWIVHDLENVNRDVHPWILVLVHCPIYNTFAKHRTDPQPVMMKRYLEPLFIKHRVNFVVSGHVHAYFRSKKVSNDALDNKGPMYIVVGNGGRQANAPFYNIVAEDWVAKRDHTTYGYGTIEFLSPEIAMYEWVQTGHNGPNDSGENFPYVPHNMTDIVYVNNQLYAT